MMAAISIVETIMTEYSFDCPVQRYVLKNAALMKLFDYQRYKKYSRETLAKAVNAVVQNKVSIAVASRMFKIPESTLKRKVPLSGTSARRTSLLSAEQEEELAEMMINRLRYGAAMTKREVYMEATRMMDIRPENRKHSPNWFWLVYFLKRHPSIPDDYFQNQAQFAYNRDQNL